jgi:hypothetical protein
MGLVVATGTEVLQAVIEVSWMKVEDQGLQRTLLGLAETAVQRGRNSWSAITVDPTFHLDWMESSTVERR